MNHFSVKKVKNSRDEQMFWIHITDNFNLQSLLFKKKKKKRYIFSTFLLLNKIKTDFFKKKILGMDYRGK